jgi:hypothetical protein
VRTVVNRSGADADDAASAWTVWVTVRRAVKAADCRSTRMRHIIGRSNDEAVVSRHTTLIMSYDLAGAVINAAV